MSEYRLNTSKIPGASFGAILNVGGNPDCEAAVAFLESNAAQVQDLLLEADGLLVMPGWTQIPANPQWLVRLSRVFGPEVENYHDTLTPPNMIHTDVEEILVLSEAPPCSKQRHRSPIHQEQSPVTCPLRFHTAAVGIQTKVSGVHRPISRCSSPSRPPLSIKHRRYSPMGTQRTRR